MMVCIFTFTAVVSIYYANAWCTLPSKIKRVTYLKILFLFLFLKAVYLSLTEEYYEVSEEDGSLHVCVELYNHTERSVYASVFAIPGTASGMPNATPTITFLLFTLLFPINCRR